jgi:hypothetical protein
MSVPLASRGEATPTWRYAKGTPYVSSPVPVNGRLYFTDERVNLLTILDAKSGQPVLDKERLPVVKDFYASPIFAADRIYFVDRTGVTLVLKPGDSIQVMATNKLDDPVDASPVAVGKKLLLRGEKFLYCLEESK